MTIPNTAEVTSPASYLFETDLNIYSSSTATFTTISLLNAEGEAILSIGAKPRSKGSTFTFTVKEGSETVEINETSINQYSDHNLRVEYTPSAEDTASVSIYVDGKLCYKNAEYSSAATEGDKDMTFSAVKFAHSDTTNTVKLRLDSTIITTIAGE